MKQIFVVLIFIVALSLSSCTNPKNKKVKTKCINGVLYYYIQTSGPYTGYGFMAPAYNRDSTVKTCDLKETIQR